MKQNRKSNKKTHTPKKPEKIGIYKTKTEEKTHTQKNNEKTRRKKKKKKQINKQNYRE